ncbi:MAG TPA: kelch repeat-containing protein [bacterium]|nr:kelch repeat-containing protein [bacterium]
MRKKTGSVGLYARKIIYGAVLGLILIFTLEKLVMAQVCEELKPVGASPDGRNGHVSVSSGGSEQFVFGGFNQNTDLWRLREEGEGNWIWENTGTREPNTPSERGGHSGIFANGFDNSIIVFGGSASPLVAPSDIVPYKLANPWDGSSKWEKLVPVGFFPPPMAEHTAVYDNNDNRMIVFGGYKAIDPVVALNETYTLDFDLAFWPLVNPGDKPPARYGHSAVWTGGQMIVFGGKDNSQEFLDDCWQFDPGLNSWTPVPITGDKPPARWQHTAVWKWEPMEPGKMIIFGGEDKNGKPLDDFWVLYTPGPGEPNYRWKRIYPIGDLPSKRSGHATGLFWGGDGEKVLIFGGFDGSNNLNDVYAFFKDEEVEQALEKKPFNAPNPFNPDTEDTKICYYLEEDDDDVKIKLFTLTGELVYSWENISGKAGLNQWPWNGKNEKGKIVENGGYICLIEAGGKKQKCKIAVLR